MWHQWFNLNMGAVVAWWIERWTCNPRLWVRISAPAGTEPPTAPRRRSVSCPLLQVWVCVCVCVCSLQVCPSVCALGCVKCRKYISLLVILCIIVYVTNKALLSLIFNFTKLRELFLFAKKTKRLYSTIRLLRVHFASFWRVSSERKP